jgi:hypothetical protein
MSKGQKSSGARAMNAAESQCWASGGVWMNGSCVRFVKATYSRGAGCDPGFAERIIQLSLPGPVREARARVMGGLPKFPADE